MFFRKTKLDGPIYLAAGVKGEAPDETFPAIGTVEDPAIFHDGQDAWLCYEVAPVDGGGTVILAFTAVVFLEKNPSNVPEGLRGYKYPICAWGFTEVLGTDRTEKWGKFMPRRFCTISFNDVAVEIVFADVRQVHRSFEPKTSREALLGYLMDR